MGFEYPKFLYLLLLIPGVIWFFIISSRKKKEVLEKFVSNEILARLIPISAIKVKKIKTFLIILSILFIIISLAGPQYGARLVEVKRRGVDIIVALDCSKSMLSEDIKPNRLEKAKSELKTLIHKLDGDRIGIIVFAGTAFLQCPLTVDYEAATMFLNLIDTNTVPIPGTLIGDAIRLAIKSFSQKERKYKVLILLTDGEDHRSNPLDAAKEAKKNGIRIFTIGIGESIGEPIPIRDESGKIISYHKDKQGKIVTSRLDEELLQKIALETNGKYYHATASEFELDNLLNEINSMEKKELKSTKQIRYENRYQIFLFLAFLSLVIEWILPERK
jgi:Ca-activated chloride channel family protein